MRALILILAAAVVGLAVSIVLYMDKRPGFVHRVGPTFQVGSLIADARGGEEATYRETTSLDRLTLKVESAPRLPPFVEPYKVIRQFLLDPRGRARGDSGAGVAYQHNLTEHGWFPLMAPEVPDALDRVWILRSIRPDKLTLNRREYDCWRVDLIDPALPEGADTVVAWLNDRIPVFGLLKWKRAGQTWEFQRGKIVN